MVVDAHAHIFPRINGQIGCGPTRGLRRGRAQVGKETIDVMPPLSEHVKHTPKMLIEAMREANVDKAILLQGPFYGECNTYAIQAAKEYPDQLIAAAYVDPWRDDLRSQIDSIIKQKEFCAVKIECSDAAGFCGIYPHAKLDDPAMSWLWPTIRDAGLTLTLDLGAINANSYQTDAVAKIKDHCPDLRLVIAHLAQPKPDMNHEEHAKWLQQIDLGLRPNVWFDTSSLPAYAASEPEPSRIIATWLRCVIDRIGADRILYGTDTPGLLRFSSYSELLENFTNQISFLSTLDRDKLRGLNAISAYGV